MKKTEFLLTPAIGKYFVGRKELIDELAHELGNPKSKIGFCLYGRRRIGKTSILMEMKQRLSSKKNVVIAYLSLYDIADLSTETFCEELVNTIMTAYQEKNLLPFAIKIKKLLEAPAEVVTELLKNAKIEATLLEHIKILLEYKQNKQNYTDYIRRAFNTGEILGKATVTKCIIVLDEFPEILKIENGMQLAKILRTQYETQQRTAIVISGSIKKTLEAVALSETSPFYKQLVPKHVMPFTMEEVKKFLGFYLGKTNMAEVEKLYELTGGLPFYLQFIGRSTGYTGSIEEVVKNFLIQEGDLFFKEEFNKLNEKEKLIVIGLSGEKKSLTELANKIKELTTTVGRYLPILIEKEIVLKESRGTYNLVDKLFGLWLKRTYGSNFNL